MDQDEKARKRKTVITIVVLAVVGILLVTMLVQGVQVHQNNTEIKISGGIFYSAKVPYSEITDVELVTSIDYGTRSNGASLGSYKLGNFKNSEFGSYKMFVDVNIPKFIVIHYGNDKTVVFNCKTEETTMEVYEGLLEHMK